jgi:hypothetical protein
MRNPFKQLKRLWQLARKDKVAMEEFMKLSDKDMMDIPNEDEKVVFIGQGTQEEFKDFENEQKGIKGIFGL